MVKFNKNVNVIDVYGRKLGNTSYALARQYLKKKKATITSKNPFTIQLIGGKNDVTDTFNMLLQKFSGWDEVYQLLNECELFEIKEKVYRSIFDNVQNLDILEELPRTLPFEKFIILINPFHKMPYDAKHDLFSSAIVGFVFNGLTCTKITVLDDDMFNFSNEVIRDGKWHCSITTKKILSTIIKNIISANITIENRTKNSVKNKLTKHKKQTNNMPTPYYKIKLRPCITEYTTSNVNRTKTKDKQWNINYRYKVSAHERIKIIRGIKPMPEAEFNKLNKYGYSIYIDSKLPQDIIDKLITRGKPLKQHSEWIAIKTIYIKEHVSGPKDAPYIPAIRVIEQNNI